MNLFSPPRTQASIQFYRDFCQLCSFCDFVQSVMLFSINIPVDRPDDPAELGAGWPRNKKKRQSKKTKKITLSKSLDCSRRDDVPASPNWIALMRVPYLDRSSHRSLCRCKSRTVALFCVCECSCFVFFFEMPSEQ